MSRARASAAAPEPEGDDPLGRAWSDPVEKAILGVVLDGRHPEAWATVREHSAGAPAFFDRNHRLIAGVIDQLATAGQPVNGSTVLAAAGMVRFQTAMEAMHGRDAKALIDASGLAMGDSVLAAVGGQAAIGNMAEAYAPATALVANVRTLDAYHRQRMAIDLLGDLYRRSKAVDGSKQVKALADEAINRLCEIAAPGRGIQSIGSGGEVSARMHDEAVAACGEAVALWGVPALDEACRLTRRRLVVLAARPGCGKTSLALQAAGATRGKLGGPSVAMVSFEMGHDELARIIIGREIGVSRRNIERGWLSTEERTKLDERIAAWKADDILVKGHGGNGTVDEIVAWIRTLHRRHAGRLHLVIIDYLGLIDGTNPRHNANERIGEITRKLKLIALDLNLCVMLLCQMSRLSAKEKRAPELTDLRDSGSIEQDADGVVLLWSDDDAEKDVVLVNAKVAKNRLGSLRTIGVEFYKAKGQRFQTIGGENPVPRGTKMHNEPTEAEDKFGDGQPPIPQQEP
jgi:replicative DNA helicase